MLLFWLVVTAASEVVYCRFWIMGGHYVDSVNLVKKHVRPNPNKGDTGGIVEREAPIDISNSRYLQR